MTKDQMTFLAVLGRLHLRESAAITFAKKHIEHVASPDPRYFETRPFEDHQLAIFVSSAHNILDGHMLSCVTCGARINVTDAQIKAEMDAVGDDVPHVKTVIVAINEILDGN